MAEPYHIFFLPFLSPGHMIPMVDLAKSFAAVVNVKATIVTTPSNAAKIQPTLDFFEHPIEVLQVPFPSSDVGLEDGIEDLSDVSDIKMAVGKFFAAAMLLRMPFDELVQKHRPDCLVSDVWYSWTVESAREFQVPLMLFHGTCGFTMEVVRQVMATGVFEEVEREDEALVVPGLPHMVELRRSQLPDFVLGRTPLMAQVCAKLSSCYGTLMNSYEELESDYVGKDKGPYANPWYVGPVSLSNGASNDAIAVRGGNVDENIQRITNWLDNQNKGSVLYVSFGSSGRFTKLQLDEIATALVSSGYPFIWTTKDDVDHLPEVGYKGLIVTGWAPQVLILNHKATGGFMTHCGWNSCLESITAGVVMVTWPLFSEQFVNEKLVVDVLRVGIGVGAMRCSNEKEERCLVTSIAIRNAVGGVMGCGEEADARRKRARELRDKALSSVEEGGSSYSNLRRLVEELVELKVEKAKELVELKVEKTKELVELKA